MSMINDPAAPPAPASTDGLSGAMTRGVFWSGTSQFAVQALSFLSNILLARLLFPADFGVLGMVAICIELISVISDLGLTAAIVQRQDASLSQLSTCFWASLLTGIILWALSTVCSPLIARFFHQESVRPVLIVSAFNFIIRSSGSVQRSLLTKQLRFKQLAIAEVSATAIFCGVSLPLAAAGVGLWSIVIGNIFESTTTSIALWLFCPWKPRWEFKWQEFRTLFTFGYNALGEAILGYVHSNTDYVLVGRLLGAAPLGVYTLAFNLMTFPVRKISRTITKVAFPAFSRLQGHDDLLQEAYIRTIRYISVITFPVMVGLLLIAPDFIPLVYGARWGDAILPLQIMCLDGLVRSVGTVVGSIQYAKGRPDIAFKWRLATIVVIVPAIAIGTRYGIVGVSIAVMLLTVVLTPISQAITNRLIGLSTRRVIVALTPAAICALLMGVFLVSILLIIHMNQWKLGYPSLTGVIGMSAVIYGAGMRLFFKDVWQEMHQISVQMLPFRRPVGVVA